MYKTGDVVVTFSSVPSFPPTPPIPSVPGMTISCRPRPRPLRTISNPSHSRREAEGTIAAACCGHEIDAASVPAGAVDSVMVSSAVLLGLSSA